MPDWISDPPLKLYIILILITGLPLLAGFLFLGNPRHSSRVDDKTSSHRGKLMFVSFLGLLLIIALRIADYSLESDREQLLRKMSEMSQGVHERNLNKVFDNVSESFRIGMASKASLKSRADSAQQAGQVTDIPFWDVNVESIDKETGKAIVNFRFKVVGNALNENQFIGEATFVRDPDKQWRLQSFRVFPPTGKKDEFQVPGLQ